MHFYDAFISYSHAKDKPIAAALQSAAQKLGKPWYRRRALRVFRDDTSLTATPSLWPSIEKALSQSRYFILLASSEAAASKWVNQEVQYWLDHNSIDTLLIGVTNGDLSWNDEVGDFDTRHEVPLPPVLSGRFSGEPKWVDLRAYRNGDKRDVRFTELAADFASAIRGMPKEDLLSEEVRQQRRSLTLAWSASMALFVFAAAAGWNWWRASVETERSLRAEEATREERDRALANESRRLAGEANRHFQNDDTSFAALIALAALPDNQSGVARPYVPEAELILDRSLRELRERAVFGSSSEEALSTNGQLIFTTSTSNTARLWDVTTGKEVVTLIGHRDKIAKSAISPDGRRVLTTAYDRVAHMWDGKTGRQIATLHGLSSPLIDATFSFDGKRLLTFSTIEDRVRVWNPDTGELAILAGAGVDLRTASFHPTAKYIVTTHDDASVRIWASDTGKQIKELDGHKAVVNSVNFSPDGRRFVTGDSAGEARVWDFDTGPGCCNLSRPQSAH